MQWWDLRHKSVLLVPCASLHSNQESLLPQNLLVGIVCTFFLQVFLVPHQPHHLSRRFSLDYKNWVNSMRCSWPTESALKVINIICYHQCNLLIMFILLDLFWNNYSVFFLLAYHLQCILSLYFFNQITANTMPIFVNQFQISVLLHSDFTTDGKRTLFGVFIAPFDTVCTRSCVNEFRSLRVLSVLLMSLSICWPDINTVKKTFSKWGM